MRSSFYGTFFNDGGHKKILFTGKGEEKIICYLLDLVSQFDKLCKDYYDEIQKTKTLK